MIKKAAIVTAGVLLLAALLFGSNLVPYAQTAWQKARNAVNDSVSVEFKLDAAERELAKVDGERKNMVYQIAKETVAIERLEEQVGSQELELDRQHAHILRLRDHLESGETHFVSHSGRYPSSAVKDDLAHRFANFKIAKETVAKTRQILDARRQSLDAAETKLNDMIAQQHTLQLEIENLRARMHMLDIAKSANDISYDDSSLSNADQMIQDIRTRLDVEAEINALLPKYTGSIPLEGEEIEVDADIIEQIDAYFAEEVDEVVIN